MGLHSFRNRKLTCPKCGNLLGVLKEYQKINISNSVLASYGFLKPANGACHLLGIRNCIKIGHQSLIYRIGLIQLKNLY